MNEAINFPELLNRVSDYVASYYESNKKRKLFFHSLERTREVVGNLSNMLEYYQLPEQDEFIARTAAWFLDVGYLKSTFNPQSNSAEIAVLFLTTENLPSRLIDQIRDAILAAGFLQPPKGLLEKIVCDAARYHVGDKDYLRQMKLLFKEEALDSWEPLSESAWLQSQLEFLRQHNYLTDYCQKLFSEQQQRNTGKIKAKIDRTLTLVEETVAKNEAAVKAFDNMLKLVTGNNAQLSYMADNKALILITVNSIILSAIISFLSRKLQTSPYLIIPTSILLTISLTAITFSILATRPTLFKRKLSGAGLSTHRVDLIFFGNFYNMDIEDYARQMFNLKGDHDQVYDMMARDAFRQGVVLRKKYNRLRIAYNVFMYGLIISAVAYLAISLLTAAPLMRAAH